MKQDYNRKLTLICPTCAADQFDFDNELEESIRQYKCASCGISFSHEEIMTSNGARIESEIERLKEEVYKDVSQDFKKMFSGMKGWKVK